MNRIPGFSRWGLTASAAVVLAACDASPLTADDSLLRYVPADTPYVAAFVEPMPDDMSDMYAAQTEAMLLMLQTIMEAGLEELQVSGAPGEAVEALEFLRESLTPESIETLGFNRDTSVVVYGYGMLPVLRATLTEGHDFNGFLDRLGTLLEQNGASLETGNIAGQTYRYLGDETASVAIVVTDEELAITIVPGFFGDEQVASMLGFELPAESIASSGRLEDIAEEYGFSSHMVALFDVERFVGNFLGSASGTDVMLLDLAGFNAQSMSAVCRDEFREMVAVAPAIVGGYTELGTEAMEMNVVFEMRQDIAAGLATIPAAAAGLGVETDALMSFGMSIDIPAARDFVMARLDAFEADPYECEELADMSSQIPMARMQLNQPLPPFVEGLTGIAAVMDFGGLDTMMMTGMPQDLSGAVMIATDSAADLLAMGALFDPQLASLDLGTDGEIVEFSLPPGFAGPGMESFETIYLAATPSALAAGIGADAETKLQQLLDAPAAAPGTFMTMSVDMQEYYGLQAEAIEMAAQMDPSMPVAVVNAMTGMMRSIQDMYSREHVTVRFTERGVEIPVRIEMAD